MFGGRKVFWCVVILLFSLVALAWAGDGKEGIDAFRQNKLLGRGVNLGDALDARKESTGCETEGRIFPIDKRCRF